MRTEFTPTTETVAAAAWGGDRQALGELVAESLPLVYNIVGRALNGHHDVDDVVQETMLSVVGGLSGLREPERFRSWLVSIALQKVRDRWRRQSARPTVALLEDALDAHDPGADFVGATIVRLGLSGQRREAVEATRWLDDADRELLSVWWLEAAGELTRAELAAALGVTPQHAAVRVQRLKERLLSARLVVRALAGAPRCARLAALTADWDGRPAPLWRKRLTRHVSSCDTCAARGQDLVPPEGLLAGFALVPVPAGLTAVHLLTGAGNGAAAGAASHAAATGGTKLGYLVQHLLAKPVAAVTAGAAVLSGGMLAGFVVLAPTPHRVHHPAAAPAASRAADARSRAAAPVVSQHPPAGPVYGQTVDEAEATVPDPHRPPGVLPRRPQTEPLTVAGVFGGSHPGATGPMYVLDHRGDHLVLSGRGYFFIRWQVTVYPGTLAMPTWTGLTGKLFHVASGGGRRMDDAHPGSPDGATWLGNRTQGYATLPSGAQQMWQNEYYYLDGTVSLHVNESGLRHTLIVATCGWQDVTRDIDQAPAPALGRIRYGVVRDTGDDAAPVPQYLTRTSPADPFAVPQQSRVS